jgi:hypothetical protein
MGPMGHPSIFLLLILSLFLFLLFIHFQLRPHRILLHLFLHRTKGDYSSQGQDNIDPSYCRPQTTTTTPTPTTTTPPTTTLHAR